MNLIDKVLFLSHPFQQKSFSLIINILFVNSYLPEFIFSIQKKLQIKFQQFNKRAFC